MPVGFCNVGHSVNCGRVELRTVERNLQAIKSPFQQGKRGAQRRVQAGGKLLVVVAELDSLIYLFGLS